MGTSRVLAASAVLTASLALGAGTASAAPSVPPPPVVHCKNGTSWNLLPTTWTGIDRATLVKGGDPVVSTLTLTNNSGRLLHQVTSEFLVNNENYDYDTDDLTVETKLPGENTWSPASFVGRRLALWAELGTRDMAAGAVFTVQIRVTAKPTATAERYDFVFGGGSSDTVDNDTGVLLTPEDLQYSGPAAHPGGPGTCTSWTSSGPAVHFTVVDAPSPSPSPSSSPSPSPSPSASPSRPSSTTTATATVTRPGTATTQAAVIPELAETGAGSALPMAAAGTALVVLGGGIVVALRRRQGSHG